MKYLILLLMLFASPAFATYCTNGATNYPKCDNNKPPEPPTKDPNWWQENHNENTNSNTQGQGQAQGQHQGQTATGGTGVGIGVGGQGGRGGNGGAGGSVGDTSSSSVSHGGNSRSNATGGTSSSTATGGLSSSTVGDTTATGGYSGGNRLNNDSQSNSGASANGVVNVDTSDRSSTNVRSNVFIPGDLPSNAMTIAPGAYITVAGDTQCGVLQAKIQVPVYQWNKRGTKKVIVGYDEDLAPVFDSNGTQIDYQIVYTGDGGYYMRGSQVTYVLTTKGSSNSAQFGAQGYAAGGGGGISAGAGRSYSEGGAKMIIRSCIAYKVSPKPVAPRPARRAATPRRKAKARHPAPVACVPRAARVCPAN